jgi:hypothetical protein
MWKVLLQENGMMQHISFASRPEGSPEAATGRQQFTWWFSIAVRVLSRCLPNLFLAVPQDFSGILRRSPV